MGNQQNKFMQQYQNNLKFIDQNELLIFGCDKDDNPVIIDYNHTKCKFSINKCKKKINLSLYMAAVQITPDCTFLSGGINNAMNAIYATFIQYLKNKNKFYHYPNMNIPRYFHSMTFFDNTIFVTGGRTYGNDDKSILKQCEYYNFKDKKWTMLPDMNFPRCSHQTVIYNSQLYVFGGFSGATLNFRRVEIERIDYIQNKWIIINMQLKVGIEGFVIIQNQVPDQILILGGCTQQEISDQIYLLDFKAETCQLMPNKMMIKRVLHKVLFNPSLDSIILLGGDNPPSFEQGNLSTLQMKIFDCNISELDNYYINQSKKIKLLLSQSNQQENFLFEKNWRSLVHQQYPINIQSDIWRDESKSQYNQVQYLPQEISNPSMIQEQSKFECSQLNKVNYQILDITYYLFGSSFKQFILEINLKQNLFLKKACPQYLQLFSFTSGVKIDDHNYFLCGGVKDDMTHITKFAFIYNSQHHVCQQLPNMFNLRYTFNILKKQHYVYVFGGRQYGSDDKAIISSCERFNLNEMKWEMITPMIEKRCSAMALLIDDKICIAGGYVGLKQRSNKFEYYNEEKNIWEQMGIQLLEPIEAALVIYVEQEQEKKILFLGGRNQKGDIDECSWYDISWGIDAFHGQKAGKLQTKRCLHKYIHLFKNTYLILGGKSAQSQSEIVTYDWQNSMIYEDKNLQNLQQSLNKFIAENIGSYDKIGQQDISMYRYLLL